MIMGSGRSASICRSVETGRGGCNCLRHLTHKESGNLQRLWQMSTVIPNPPLQEAFPCGLMKPCFWRLIKCSDQTMTKYFPHEYSALDLLKHWRISPVSFHYLTLNPCANGGSGPHGLIGLLWHFWAIDKRCETWHVYGRSWSCSENPLLKPHWASAVPVMSATKHNRWLGGECPQQRSEKKREENGTIKFADHYNKYNKWEFPTETWHGFD